MKKRKIFFVSSIFWIFVLYAQESPDSVKEEQLEVVYLTLSKNLKEEIKFPPSSSYMKTWILWPGQEIIGIIYPSSSLENKKLTHVSFKFVPEKYLNHRTRSIENEQQSYFPFLVIHIYKKQDETLDEIWKSDTLVINTHKKDIISLSLKKDTIYFYPDGLAFGIEVIDKNKKDSKTKHSKNAYIRIGLSKKTPSLYTEKTFLRLFKKDFIHPIEQYFPPEFKKKKRNLAIAFSYE